jgi:hypothetical protein
VASDLFSYSRSGMGGRGDCEYWNGKHGSISLGNGDVVLHFFLRFLRDDQPQRGVTMQAVLAQRCDACFCSVLSTFFVTLNSILFEIVTSSITAGNLFLFWDEECHGC